MTKFGGRRASKTSPHQAADKWLRLRPGVMSHVLLPAPADVWESAAGISQLKILAKEVYQPSDGTDDDGGFGSKTNGSRVPPSYFFFPPFSPSSFLTQSTTLPSITTPFPSMKATRERPSQFLKLSHTNGCCGVNQHSAISLLFNE